MKMRNLLLLTHVNLTDTCTRDNLSHLQTVNLTATVTPANVLQLNHDYSDRSSVAVIHDG